MKSSIRAKFTIGIIFFFVIILVLSIFSALLLNRLSKKTSAILKENYVSVVFAREMAEGLMKINQEVMDIYISDRKTDSLLIQNELIHVEKSLQSEKNNITEPGEDELVKEFESGLNRYRNAITKFIREPRNSDGFLDLQKGYAILYQELMKLSQMNGKAIELKTDDAKLSSKRALTQMTILATLCFLIALSFTFSFASYFNERFFQLYKGIREIASDNYGQRLHFEGNDEFHEISLVFNEMAGKLSSDKAKMDVTLVLDPDANKDTNDLIELKKLLTRLKSMEKQSMELIARLENKK